MPPTGVSILSVSTRSEYPTVNRISYQVRLSCGCEWWEHRAIHEPPPTVGGPAYCCAMHVKAADAPVDAEVGYSSSWVPERN